VLSTRTLAFSIVGNSTTRPSSVVSITIWQLSRLVGRRSAAVIVSIASSSTDTAGSRSAHSGAT
jgi:hypothetical protein